MSITLYESKPRIRHTISNVIVKLMQIEKKIDDVESINTTAAYLDEAAMYLLDLKERLINIKRNKAKSSRWAQ